MPWLKAFEMSRLKYVELLRLRVSLDMIHLKSLTHFEQVRYLVFLLSYIPELKG